MQSGTALPPLKGSYDDTGRISNCPPNRDRAKIRGIILYDSGEKEFAQFYSQEQQRQDRVKRSPEDEKQAIGGFVGQKSDSKEPQKNAQETEQGVDKSAEKVNEQSRDKEPSTTVLDGEGDAAGGAEPLSNTARPSEEVAQTTPIAASEDDFYQQLFAQLSMSTELPAVARKWAVLLMVPGSVMILMSTLLLLPSSLNNRCPFNASTAQ